MSRIKDGLRVATCIFESAAWNRSVHVQCSCGHAAFFQAHGLWALFEKRGWSDEFREMRARFYCSRCRMLVRRKVRPNAIAASSEAQTITLPMPAERDWKRALSRFRS